MTGRFIVFSIALSLLFTAGCSKNRGWLSRNDYSEIQDPFMEPDSTVAKSSSPSTKAAGRASLDESKSAMAEGRARVPGPAFDDMAGPKPIRPAGSSSGLTDDGRRISPATYPESYAADSPGAEKFAVPRTEGVTSYSGPALSDFLQKKSAAALDTASQTPPGLNQLPTRTVSAPGDAARDSLNPAATHAALPTISPEAESFNSFLSQKSRNAAAANQRTNDNVQAAGADVGNFAAWAEQQKSEWSNSANTTRTGVTEAPVHAKEKIGNVFQQARLASEEMANTKFAAPEFEIVDTAEPLIKQPGSKAATPTLSKAKPPAANNFTADENPFADSFTDFHSGGSASGADTSSAAAGSSAKSSPTSTARSLDDSFRMDTGWKPAQMTRP